MTTMGLVKQAGRKASVGRHRLTLVNISFYLDRKEIKRGPSRHVNKLFQNMTGWHCRASQTGDAIHLCISVD